MRSRSEREKEQDRLAKRAKRARLRAEGFRVCTVAVEEKNLAVIDTVAKSLGLTNRDEALNALISQYAGNHSVGWPDGA